MIYNISHKTTYRYRSSVSFGNHVACLTPRSLPHHRCEWSELQIDPPPASQHARIDYFGNRLTFFAIRDPHRESLCAGILRPKPRSLAPASFSLYAKSGAVHSMVDQGEEFVACLLAVAEGAEHGAGHGAHHQAAHAPAGHRKHQVGAAIRQYAMSGLARRRIEDPWVVGVSVLLGVVLPFFGPFIYMLFRPPEYLEDVRERELEIKAMEDRLAKRDLHCPVCRSEVDSTFLVCPICTTKLKQSCSNCKAPLEALWQVCPYCETAVEPTAVALPTLEPRRRRRAE